MPQKSHKRSKPARDKGNLQKLIQGMSDEDEGIRWWAVIGLHLLEKDTASAADGLEGPLSDESHELRMMAAWTLIKIAKSDKAPACLDDLLFKGTNNQMMLFNVLDRMGEPALPLVKKYVEKGGNRKGRNGVGILGRVAQL